MSELLTGGEAVTPKVTDILARVRRFIADELEPLCAREGLGWEAGTPRPLLRQVWSRSRELGLYGIQLPTAIGGAGLTVSEQATVKEAIYASGCSLAPHIMGELSGPPRVGALYKVATPDQVERIIRPVLEARLSACFALTEENAGSDAGNVQTRAVRTADGWRLNGRKKYISGSPFADLAVVIASTSEDPKARELSAFFVEADRPGYRIDAGYKTMAGGSHTGDIVLEDCDVPAGNLIGERGRGLALSMGRITVNRLLHCPAMLGLARIALESSIRRARTRSQFGRPIAAFQAIQHMIADMATELAAARALMYQVAAAIDAGGDPRAQAAMAKVFCSETAFRIADRAVQVHGGEGIIQGNVVEWIFRMLRMYRITTGTSEIQRNTIAKALLDPEG
ncbi:MAG: acyl-CoA dehydrogenase family protein [Burkholderiaceae bacterium]